MKNINKVELVNESQGDIKSVIILDTVKTIGNNAFSYNQLTSIEIPSSVTSIGNWAFSRNQLTSAEIKNSNTILGGCVFNDNYNLTTVKVAGIDKDIYEISPCDL